MLEIGQIIDGKYKILNKVGQGGMSVVYLAMNEKANKQWAVKEVRKDGIKDFEVVRQGLVTETEMLKRFNHPNLPSIVDVIEDEHSLLIVMDYIQGNPLSKSLEEYGAQPQENVIIWAKQLCDVLSYLHTRTPPIIYRDLKPQNVMLKPDGNICLIDFGTAREYKEKNLADTTCLGTIGYAAPEQFGGMGQTDARTDIYNFGATIYHLVTGQNPCEEPYKILPIRQINPSLSSGLERIIEKCTQPSPDDRYQSCAELMYALEHYEEIDEIYRRSQLKKLLVFVASFVLTLMVFSVSAYGYFGKEDAKSGKYQDYIHKAAAAQTQEDMINNYMAAISWNMTKPDAYNLLLDLFNKDHAFTGEESTVITKLYLNMEKNQDPGVPEKNSVTAKPLDELKAADPTSYKAFCYEVALAYWHNYVDSDGKVTAATWFQYAMFDGKPYEAAETYLFIGDALNKIDDYRDKKNFGKMYPEYKKLLQQLVALNTDVQKSDDDRTLLAWREIVRILDEYATYFLHSENKKLPYDENSRTLMINLLNDITSSANVMIGASNIPNNIEDAKKIIYKINGDENNDYYGVMDIVDPQP